MVSTPEPSDSDLPDGTWSVADLTREIEQVLAEAESRFPTHVVGEVVDVDEYDFGTFFDLQDLETSSRISCLAWSSTIADAEHDLTAGTTTVVEAAVDFYPDRGDCQLLVTGYWPLGESARQQELATLREELAEEGLFAEERKQAIPAYPACVGLVTSSSGSAREDVWAAIQERSPRTDVILCGATVQGEDAVESQIAALQTLDGDPGVEMIILTRGGGADVDLWCYNAEPLVRCVAACDTPVIAAIGHEDDEALVEDVADERAMTPTEAGVVAVTTIEAVLSELAAREQRIGSVYETLVDERLTQLERRVETAHQRLAQQTRERAAVLRRVHDLEHRVTIAYDSLVETRLDAMATRLDQALQEHQLAAESEAAAERVARGRVADLEARIDAAYRAHINQELDAFERRLDSAYRDLEAEARIEAGTAEARRLRIVVAILIALLVLAACLIGYLFVV